MKAIMLRCAVATLMLVAAAGARGGLVAHFRFDGDLEDATGGHDGRPVDAKHTPRFTPGRVGAALVIEQATAGIEVANPAAIDLGGDLVLQPDAPDSVLRIGCRGDGDTWRYARSHLRGLVDELQIYDESLTAADIRFLFEHPGSDAQRRQPVRFEPRFQLDAGHPWRPPFGVDRVGNLAVVVQFASDDHPAPPHALVAYRNGVEVERRPLEVAGVSPFTARVNVVATPAPDELVLVAHDGGEWREQARWRVNRPSFEADAEAVAEPVTNPVDSGSDFSAGGLARAWPRPAGPGDGRGFLGSRGVRRGGSRVVRVGR